MLQKFSSIQIIRAIAALSVVMFHSHFAVASFPDEYKTTLPFIYKWGYLGVDLFFVVSGFIIAHIASKGKFQPASFLTRRFFRIYPLYWIFCGTAVYLQLCYGYNLGGGELGMPEIIKSFTIFPLENHPPYAVGWTLEHEIIFYLLSAVVLYLSSFRIFIIILSLLGGAGLVLPILVNQGTLLPFWDYHLLSPTHINFLTGILIYKNQDRLIKFKSAGPLLAFIIIFFTWENMLGWPNASWNTLISTLGTSICSALLIMAFLNSEKLNSGNPNSLWHSRYTKFMIGIGNASFSLYLVHWIIFMEMGRNKWKIYFELPDHAAESYRIAIIAATVLLAFLMYKLIETPLIALGHWIAKRLEK
ncbi:acyltransferase [Janthinobacterium sp.]|uniref:acyltransferase family protein n=1 Tax=Janthinobacterium sp. TaxID=1871054 RepID=UPI00258326C8|nr:acyltransferase [Janthinobacterium sp.]MCX7291724.1 acyltransferase [Janthinobacterium sp.]